MSDAALILKTAIEQVESIQEEVATLNESKSEVYAELKKSGFDTKIVRQLVKERSKSPEELEEQEQLLETYRTALEEV